jgi:hypothetical protein
MLEDKAMIIIAVSKYADPYPDLPGTITSARRLREWAEQPDEDCNYKVLYLADDVFEKIDVQLVREKVREFVKNNFIDRLVVYFAGHGIVRSAGDQFWLLTDAADDEQEGIDVEGFRRGLLKCNISNADFAGQLCIIGDACRNTARDGITFKGHSILTSTANMNKLIQLDKFLSTGLGDYSFQINQIGSQSAYCLFSEVMLTALRGEVMEAIDTENHEFKPVVTNHKLADYLEKEVRIRAAAINKKMKPDIDTSIRPPYNFYKRLKKPITDVIVSSQNQQLTAAIQMAIRDSRPESSDEQLTAVQALRKRNLLQWKERITLNHLEPYSDNPDKFFTFSDDRPKIVALPKSSTIKVKPKMDFYEIQAIDCYHSPILIYQDQRWLLIPNYSNVINVISNDLPGDILFLKTGYSLFFEIREKNRSKDVIWDTYLSDFSNLIGSVPLRAADAQKFADKIRIGKEEYPHQAVTAGYLYEFSNDYNNIARTAHYMYENTGGVPFDLALLCADKIWWRKESGRFVAFADLPAVEPSQTSDNEKDRPYYARIGFKERKNVQLLGIAPIFSQGWSFMQTELYLDIPEEIRSIGENMSGRSAASLTDKGLRMFLEAFDYRVVEIDT